MTVYVDDAQRPYGRMKMCHMMADTQDELQEMAKKLKLRGEWFQAHRRHPHYDICLSKRRLAVKYGAKEVTSRELINIINKANFTHGDNVVVILLGEAYDAQVIEISPVKHVATTRPDTVKFNIPLRMPYTMGELRALDPEVAVYKKAKS